MGRPIAWIRHFNLPDESPAIIPGSWGAEFAAGMGVKPGSVCEIEFSKNVYGTFTGTNIAAWLKKNRPEEVLITGFYTHGCVSTTTREAIMANLKAFIDTDATATCDLNHEILEHMPANEVKRSALLHLGNMGAVIVAGNK